MPIPVLHFNQCNMDILLLFKQWFQEHKILQRQPWAKQEQCTRSSKFSTTIITTITITTMCLACSSDNSCLMLMLRLCEMLLKLLPIVEHLTW